MTISSGAISDTYGMLPAMKMTEPYSPTRAREGEREAGEDGRAAGRGRMTRRDRLAAAGAERRGGLLDLAVDLLQHRLHGAHHEGQADEDQRDDDAERRVGDLDAERRQQLPDPAVRRVERGQRDAGDGRRQREGQVDHRVDDAPAGKAVAHQHPGDEHAEDDVDAARRSARRRS